MSDAATVSWTPEAPMMLVQPGQRILHTRDERKFSSLENALRYVMETLPAGLRSTAMIQTDDASIQIEDIERMYAGLAGG
jgi:hypothetical protein